MCVMEVGVLRDGRDICRSNVGTPRGGVGWDKRNEGKGGLVERVRSNHPHILQSHASHCLFGGRGHVNADDITR